MTRLDRLEPRAGGELATPVVAALLVLAIGVTLVGVTCRGRQVGADPPPRGAAPQGLATTASVSGSAMIVGWTSASISSTTTVPGTASASMSWRPVRGTGRRSSCCTASPSAGPVGGRRSDRWSPPACG